MRALRILLGCALLVVAGEACSQAKLAAETQRVDLWPQVTALADPAGKLGPQEAFAARDRFGPPPGAYATLGMDTIVTWLRVPVSVAAGGEGTWVLDIDYALLQRVDVYVFREGRLAHRETIGNVTMFADQPLAGRAPAVPLEFAAGGATELLLRVDTPGAKIVPLALSRLSAFHVRALDEQMLQGALACLGFVLLLYSLAQWVALRESLYLKYALLTLCSAVFSAQFFGIGEMYVWTDIAWYERHMAGVTALMATTATALFVEDALAGDLHRGLRVALRAVAAIHTVATIAYGFDVIDLRVVAILMTTTGLAPGLMGVPGALAMARRGDSVGAWFIFSWVGYFVASAVMVGVVRGRVDANFWTLHSFQFGATLDMLVFMRIAVLRTTARLVERRRLQSSFAGYVSPAVMEEILGGRLSPETGGEQRYVCLLFSDIRGYTMRSESMKPADLLAFLNSYFEGVVAIIHRHGGTVVSFMGDGIMAVFGAPQRLANPCDAGFRAAREMSDNLAGVNRRLAAQGIASIDIGVGLHAGEAVVGHIGGRKRHEYAAIGDVTNVAARLENSTKDMGFRILLSEEVARHLPSREGLMSLGPVALKGHTPVEAHGAEPISLRDS